MTGEERDDIADQLIKKLFSGQGEPENLHQYIEIHEPKQFFSTYLKILSDLDLSEKAARYHYRQIMKHREVLDTAIGRDVGFRVAMLDYLININPKLTCPKIIELSNYTELLAQTTLDGLTGIFNRRFFDEQLLMEINRSKRYNNTFSLILFDIDDFKKINDTHGHTVGDRVLEDLAAILKGHLRSEDIAARYGGEEFTILLPQTDIEGAQIFADRLLENIREYHFTDSVRVTFSGGIANFPRHGVSEQQLIEAADKGLYESKLRGKNRITVMKEDRRDTTRYSIEEPLFLSPPLEEPSRGTMRNISLTGLSGESPKLLNPGELVNLQFYHPEEQRNIEILAQIVWIEKHTPSRRYSFGARYKTQDRDALYDLVSRYVPKGPRRNETR